MLKINQICKVITVLMLAIAFGLLLFSGCTDEKQVVKTETVVEKDTVYVSIIAVDAINADMDSVTQGLPIQLTIQITKGSQVGDVTINWFATGGNFDSETGDTVTWTSPDDPGVYTITAHVTDGQYIGIGSRMVGVGMYVPTVTPFYLGVDACAGCHSTGGVAPPKYDEWIGTAHAHAWQTLEESGHASASCYPCHSVGWDYDSTQTPSYPIGNTGDSGFDEAPIEKFVNVQCENCHGPGSDHVEAGGDITKIEVSYDLMTCAKCHNGTHHPFLSEWQSSPHNFNPRTGSCEGCHEGVAASIRLSGESAAYPLGAGNFYGGGSIAERPEDVPAQPAVCQTCHDPHSAENPHQLRTVADVQLIESNGESPVITVGGKGKLCMQCHHARHSWEEHIPEGDAHFGPHHSPQADMLDAKTGYTGVADPSFNWAGPSHLLIEDACITCHMYTNEYISSTEPAIVGHEFVPKPEACAQCHGQIEDFEDILAADDFDGNGIVEGLEIEVEGLLDILKEAIVASGLDTTVVGFEDAIGDTTYSNLDQRKAGWNWVFVEEDRSHGFHNPDYVVQLLQQSILYIGGTLPSNAKIVKNDNEVVSNW